MKITRLFTFAIPAIAVMAVATAQAALPTCADNIVEVQKQWDKVYHRDQQGGHPQAKDALRMAKEFCQQGKSGDATNHLDVVRSHLNMPVISKTIGTSPVDTLHSDGPSTHHDPQLTPAMSSKAGPAVPTGRDDHHNDAADHYRQTGEKK